MGAMAHWGGQGMRRSAVAGPAVLLVATALVAGCTSVGSIQASPPSLAPAPVQPAAPRAMAHPAPVVVPDGQPGSRANLIPVPQEAAETASRVRSALEALAGQSRKPSTGQVVEALAAAGFTGPGVEVTATRTPTGLEADAVESAVLQDDDCIIGHVREGVVSVTVLPVLATGRCFVGSALQ